MESTAPIGQQQPKQLLKERKDFMNTDRPANQFLNNYDTNNINNANIKQELLGGMGGTNVLSNIVATAGNPVVDDNLKGIIQSQQPPVQAPTNGQQENLASVRGSSDKYNFLKGAPGKMSDSNNAGPLRQQSQQVMPVYQAQIPTQQQQIFQSNANLKLMASTAATNDIWVKKWVDYSSKYGLGYLLSNGQSGAFFNDSTKILLDPNSQY